MGRPKFTEKERERNFWRRVDKGRGLLDCWEWRGSLRTDGYGQMSDRDRKSKSVHRFAWAITYGEIPEGKHVLHKCDNRICVNPVHLYLGTHADNMLDRSRRHRQARGETNGRAKISESNVVEIKTLLSEGWLQKKIAHKFGVDIRTISAINCNATWRHVS